MTDGCTRVDEALKRAASFSPSNAVLRPTEIDRLFRAVPPEDRPKFQRLAEVLQSQLAGVTVYKLGEEAEKQVLIVGKTPDGRWAGLKTTVVET